MITLIEESLVLHIGGWNVMVVPVIRKNSIATKKPNQSLGMAWISRTTTEATEKDNEFWNMEYPRNKR